ncbi:MAG: hypothetical protein JSR59_20405 [Proteobacteria bacterium]|nr:hypothetical protein [Pseudomonadota bacterium]
MRLSNTTASLFGAALCAIAAQTPAHADWVTLPNSGAPMVACNPKTGTPPTQTQSPTLTTCKVTGLPPAILTGYVQAAQVYTGATEGASITINSVVVGTRYDRVYCKGTVTGTIPNQVATCDYTQPLVIATRLQMSPTPNNTGRNTHCPVWAASPNNDCFEVNNVFRLIRGSNPVFNGSGGITTPAVEVTTSIAYFMGTTDGSSDPNLALAKKYLEYAGKSSKGLNQYTPLGNANYINNPVTPGDRDATHVMFQSDTNVYDPDANPPYSYSSQWSPWVMARMSCPTGYNAPTAGTFSIRLYEGGEEGQVNQNISSTGYSCKP